jgi:hypothetical protein
MVRALLHRAVDAGYAALTVPFVVVAVVSVLVGVVAYVGTVRGVAGEPSAMGFGEPATAGAEPTPGYTYLQVSTQRVAVRDRLLGIIGLVLLLALGAAALAFGLYQAGHLVNQTIEAFLE